ncbi:MULTISPECIES: hypothetical protein [unclassified Paracoccus (in: a-proteobacteria)]|uniref:hypothetical protein n=1 Tax=unclassified Paracoccus (in: a-proteobacteria) TaxID=2688777 RepID=UPI0016033C21|nr:MULTISPECIES: hypothetical protein [unclassified Paracoccus (in: a-proteobacteria)]MBB1492393.1 hypothetical protein [Paracoccus sp. MC1854]MBB1496779.1 hypothetical protein [Paracoccus sp. MC1862]QQO45413.1 hypothetical protein JGR78_03385 [Paracoccus sp. MC1862]
MSTCARQCWIFAAVMGVVVFAFGAGSVGTVPGLFLGLVTAGLLGGLLIILFCQGADDVEEWARPVDSAKDPDVPGARSIRRDGAPVAQVPIARPQRPEGMDGAPHGASVQAAQAVTFGADGSGPNTTDASRLARRAKAAVLAEVPETAHSGAVGHGESA